MIIYAYQLAVLLNGALLMNLIQIGEIIMIDKERKKEIYETLLDDFSYNYGADLREVIPEEAQETLKNIDPEVDSFCELDVLVGGLCYAWMASAGAVRDLLKDYCEPQEVVELIGANIDMFF